MKSESVVGHFTWDAHNKIPTVLGDLGVVTSAEATEMVKSCVAKKHYKIKAKFVKTVVDTFEETIQTSYSNGNEALESAMVMSSDTPSLTSSVQAKITCLTKFSGLSHLAGVYGRAICQVRIVKYVVHPIKCGLLSENWWKSHSESHVWKMWTDSRHWRSLRSCCLNTPHQTAANR